MLCRWKTYWPLFVKDILIIIKIMISMCYRGVFRTQSKIERFANAPSEMLDRVPNMSLYYRRCPKQDSSLFNGMLLKDPTFSIDIRIVRLYGMNWTWNIKYTHVFVRLNLENLNKFEMFFTWKSNPSLFGQQAYFNFNPLNANPA